GRHEDCFEVRREARLPIQLRMILENPNVIVIDVTEPNAWQIDCPRRQHKHEGREPNPRFPKRGADATLDLRCERWFGCGHRVQLISICRASGFTGLAR